MDKKKTFRRIGLVMFVVLFTYTVVFSSITSILAEALLGKGTLAKLISTFTTDALTLLLCFGMLRRLPLGETSTKTKISPKKFIIIFCIMLFVTFTISGLTREIITGIYNFCGINYNNSEVFKLVIKEGIISSFFTVVIFAPVFEELLFRKFFFERLRPYGIGFAIFITSLSFGIFHGNFEQVPYTFVMGVVFAYLMTITGDIRVPILAHSMNNFISWTAMIIQSTGSLVNTGISSYLCLISPMLGLVFIVHILMKNHGQLKLPEEITDLNKSDILGMIKTPGYTAFIIMELALGIVFITKAIITTGAIG